jgi:hypothetical protein
MMAGQLILSQRGGVWNDVGFQTWPFSHLGVYDSYFEVDHARFTKENVVALKPKRFLLSSGLHIVHTNPNAPKRLVFWSFNFSALVQALKHIGFSLEGAV